VIGTRTVAGLTFSARQGRASTASVQGCSAVWKQRVACCVVCVACVLRVATCVSQQKRHGSHATSQTQHSQVCHRPQQHTWVTGHNNDSLLLLRLQHRARAFATLAYHDGSSVLQCAPRAFEWIALVPARTEILRQCQRRCETRASWKAAALPCRKQRIRPRERSLSLIYFIAIWERIPKSEGGSACFTTPFCVCTCT